MCIFESDTVKNDCPVQIFRKMIKVPYDFTDHLPGSTTD